VVEAASRTPMKAEERARKARELSYTTTFIALVFAATLVSVETPITRGYFNLGETE